MISNKEIELKLGEYRARHTGKDPFGPWTDLRRLYESLSDDGKRRLDEVLNQKLYDPFWGDFIQLFFSERKKESP